MAIWYEVEKTEDGMHDFMECNWRFHDFMIQNVVYDPEERVVELFLRYQPIRESIRLRFMGVHAMRVIVESRDGYLFEIEESFLFLQNGMFLWIDGGDLGEYGEFDIDEIKKQNSWVEAERIVWAVCDETGAPREMPPGKEDQVWTVYGKTEQHHFTLTPCVDPQ